MINFEDFPRARDPKLPSWQEFDERQRREMLRNGVVPIDYPRRVAADWPDLLKIVEEKVKPARASDNRESYRRYWWRFAERRGSLYAGIEGSERVLVISRVSENLGFAFCPQA